MKCFQTFKAKPDDSFIAKFPNIFRWYKHIASFESDFGSLPGDPSKAYTAYGPETVALPVKAAAKAEEEDDDEVDLFGSDDEEEDAEAARIREERLAEYNKKKAAKPKTVAKSIVTLDGKNYTGHISPLFNNGQGYSANFDQ